jgi:hypothetical protein
MATILKARPPKPKKADGKPFRGFRTDPILDARLDELARRHGLSKSEVLRQAVNHIYEQEFGLLEKPGAA